MSIKRLHVSMPTLCWIGLVVLAGGIRLLLIYLKWPIPDSDEAIIDIMAKHIAYGGERPVFYYGQSYMGTIQAYLGALLMHIFGVSIFTVRLGVLLLYTACILCMYVVVKLLYTTWFAIASLVLFCFGTATVLQTPLLAKGGYAETPLFSALIFLLTSWIALTTYTSYTSDVMLKQRGKRCLLYAALGCVYGLGVWSDQLILPAIITSGLFLLLCCRRELFALPGIILLLGVFIGAYPLIAYNLHATATTNSLYSLLQTTGYGEKRIVTFPQQIVQALLLTVPATTGLTPLCNEHLPVHQMTTLSDLFSGPQPVQCVLVQGSWTFGILILWCIAVCCVVMVLWRLRLQGKEKAWVEDIHRLRVRQYGRLMILSSGALWLFFFIMSRASAEAAYIDNRYLACITITTPAVTWPLWLGLRQYRRYRDGSSYSQIARPAFWQWGASLLVTSVILYMAIRGTIEIFASLPQVEAVDRQRTALIVGLEQLHIDRAYSEYWTCNWIIIESNERVICSNVTDQLKPGFDRYQPYRQMVYHTAHPGYIFPEGWNAYPTIASLPRRLGRRYHHMLLAGYLVYYYR